MTCLGANPRKSVKYGEHTGAGKTVSEAETNREHTDDEDTHEHQMNHEQNNEVHFRETFRASLMKHANQIREKHEDATCVSLTVYFMKCSMKR